MYGKVFDSIYDGTLYGHWEAIVTMQQLIVLATPDGVVDMTPQAIAARTSIPFEIIEKGLKLLSDPDPYTRTPGEDGRRIVLMDDHRPWGWHIVNHGKYRAMRDMDQKREADRERIAEKRNKNKDVAIGRQHVANVAHSDSDSHSYSKEPSGAFMQFWEAWPKHSRKQSKGLCWERWKKFKLDPAAAEIIKHVEALKRSADWCKDAGAFIPAPLVYLNQRRWQGAETAGKPEPQVAMP